MSRLPGGWVALMVLIALAPAHAQAPENGRRGVPDIPSGEGLMVGRVVHPGGEANLADLPVGLYSLAADGSPSMSETTTDPDGNFRFEDISNSSGVVYLLGTRFHDVSYGTRAAFEAGQTQLNVELEVSLPTSDPAGISIEKTTLELGWHGDQLAVQERIQLTNPGQRVFYLDADDRQAMRSPLEALIPQTAHTLAPAMGMVAEHLELEDGAVRYWGPVYPGGGEVAYSYLVPRPAREDVDEPQPIPFRRQFPTGSGSVVVLVPSDDPEVRAEGLAPGPETKLRGRSYRTLEASNLAPGATIELTIEPPTRRSAAGSIDIKQATAWIELDDTILDVNMEYLFETEGPGWIAGTPDTPLLHLDMPAGAEFRSVSSTVDQLGVEQSPNGGIDVVGPVPAGESRLSIRYRLPPGGKSTSLDLRFPFRVPLLNVLVADTGIVIETDRMHRRRPTRSGTRLYLHREAFQVEPGETVHLELRPLGRQSTSQLALVAPFFIAACIAAWFMVTPLREPEAGAEREPDDTSTRNQREAIYEAIRDLDHDFETGKLSEEDHRGMRAELRAEALAWMRQEARPDPAQPGSREPLDPPAQCAECGAASQPNWSFCSHCGARMDAEEVNRGGVES